MRLFFEDVLAFVKNKTIMLFFEDIVVFVKHNALRLFFFVKSNLIALFLRITKTSSKNNDIALF